MALISPTPKQQFFDAAGNPLIGGKLYSYAAGTSTPLATYTDYSGGIANSNPIVLDARGEANVWLAGSSAYKFVLKDSNDVIIWTVDNINNTASDPLTLLAASNGSSLVGFIQSGTGAVARTVQDKSRDIVNLNDFLSAAQKADIAAHTMLIDCSAAWNAAVASFPEQATSPLDATYYSSAGTLVLPAGTIYFASTRNIERNIRILGQSSPDGNSFGATRLAFAANTDGLVVQRYNTGSSGKGGDGAIIENIAICTKTYISTGGTIPTGTGSGIWLRARATIRNCTTAGFAEYGVKIIASSGGGGTAEGNANCWKIQNLRTIENRLDGLYVNGADANAGTGLSIDASSNLGRGIYDASFLGNTFVGCHTASNTGAPYKTSNLNARALFIGCYTEGGQPVSEVIAPSMYIGGANDFGVTGSGASWGFSDVGIRVPDGSLTQPSIARSNDPTNGFFGTSAGVWQLTQGGVSRCRWESGGGFKASVNGTYYLATQNAHEFVQNSSTIHCSIDYLTSSSYTGRGKYVRVETAPGTGFNLFTGDNSTTQAFIVLGNGNVQNVNNSYGAISDIKLKTDISDATSQWEDIKSVKIKKYRLKSDPESAFQIGVIAQELEQTSPGLVSDVPDRNANGDLTNEITKSVKYSVLTIKALKALQEAMARIEALEIKLAAQQGVQ